MMDGKARTTPSTLGFTSQNASLRRSRPNRIFSLLCPILRNIHWVIMKKKPCHNQSGITHHWAGLLSVKLQEHNIET